VYFDKDLYMFRTDLLSIIRSLTTVYTAVGICHASYVDCLLGRSECSILTSLAGSAGHLTSLADSATLTSLADSAEHPDLPSSQCRKS